MGDGVGERKKDDWNGIARNVWGRRCRRMGEMEDGAFDAMVCGVALVEEGCLRRGARGGGGGC